MKTIRSKVFETNSSSSHSITVRTDGVWDYNFEPNENGVIVLRGGQFGWGEECYDDAETKANYVALDMILCGNEDGLDLVKEVIRDRTGFDVEVDIDTYSYCVYIDHQSVGTAAHDLCTKEDIEAFIFNKASILDIDNDNH